MLRAFLALLVAVPAVAAPADWTATVVQTPEGGFRMGNPAAKVKLVEYASLTCPHCRAFHAEGFAPLKAKYIATGKVSYEFRNFVLNGPDYAASLLARCDGAKSFFPAIVNFFDKQPEWVKPFSEIDTETAEKLSKLEPRPQIAALARAGKLDVWMRARGMTAARFDACLAGTPDYDRLAKLRELGAAAGVTGTPSFAINGTLLSDEFLGAPRPVLAWGQLEPKIVAALR